MGSNPILVALAIVAGVALLGLIISSMRSTANFKGYEEEAADAREISRGIKGEIFRDGDDLVVSGTFRKWPVVVRFSFAENTPGLNVRMRVPANFTLSVVPKGQRATEGRVLVRTSDEMFDARFATRTDHPTQARMFIGGKTALTHLMKLCCSSKTFLTLATGNLELSELVIPTPYAARHVLDHLNSMSILATALREMPGADALKIEPYEREKSRVVQLTLAAGVVTAVLVVAAALEKPKDTASSIVHDVQVKAPEGVLPADAAHMGNVEHWRLGLRSDFDPTGAGWMRGAGHDPSGRLEGKYAGAGRRPDPV